MKLVNEITVRFVTKPIAYLCHVFDPDRHPGFWEFHPEKRPDYSTISAVPSNLDEYTLPSHGKEISIRYRMLGFDCESKRPIIFDMGKGIHFMKSLFRDEYFGDIRTYDLNFKFNQNYGPGDWVVIPKVPKSNKESEKFIYDCEQFIKDSRAGGFEFNIVPSKIPWAEFEPMEDIAIDITDGSKYAKLKSEGETCTKCKTFYDMAEKNPDFTCWSCRNL